MKPVSRVLLIGGSGFIGSAVAARLSARGISVTVPTRRLQRALHLLPLPTVRVVEADIAGPDALNRLAAGHDGVVYLPGTLHGDFESVHVTMPEQAACAAAAVRASHFVHLSALGASITAPSRYLQSKERGEAAILRVADTFPDLKVSILRPSVVFGERDRFLNLFASLARYSPFIPLGSPSALFQPVWVDDVALAVERCLTDPAAAGHTWPLVGPRIYTLAELVGLAMSLSGHRRPILKLGNTLSHLQALVFEHLPGQMITRDNLLSMRVPNTSEAPFPFGAAHDLETIAAGYLHPRRLVDEYTGDRETAGRRH